MSAQHNHQNEMAHIEVDYPYYRIYPVEPLSYQSSAQRRMEESSASHVLAESHGERLPYSNHWSTAGSYAQC